MNHETPSRKLVWAVRLVFTAGVLASLAANVLHANESVISKAFAAWPPLALALTVELVSRVPVRTRKLAALRIFATSIVAAIAAWISYGHMVDVVARYGETGLTPYLLPVSVDGMIVVASICLVELSPRIRTTRTDRATAGTIATPAPADPAPKPAAPQAPRESQTPPAHWSASTPTPAGSGNRPRGAAPAKQSGRKANPPTSKPQPPSRTTNSGAAVDVGSAVSAPANPALLSRAAQLASSHRVDTGSPITAGELAVRLRVPSATASQLLALVEKNPLGAPVTPVNGHKTA